MSVFIYCCGNKEGAEQKEHKIEGALWRWMGTVDCVVAGEDDLWMNAHVVKYRSVSV